MCSCDVLFDLSELCSRAPCAKTSFNFTWISLDKLDYHDIAFGIAVAKRAILQSQRLQLL